MDLDRRHCDPTVATIFVHPLISACLSCNGTSDHPPCPAGATLNATTGAADPELSEAGLRRPSTSRVPRFGADRRDLREPAGKRAQQTARPLLDGRDLEIRTSDGIAEWDQHSSEYVPVEELKAANDPRWHAMLAGEWSVDESEEDFRYRVVSAIEGIIGDHGGQRVAVVCHGGVINGYLSHVLGLDTFARGFFYPNYTSINRVAAALSGERSVVTVNETSPPSRHRAAHGSLPERLSDGRPPTDDPTDDLIDFLDASPSPWHAVASTIVVLVGFERLDEADPWDEIPAAGYVVRGGAIIARRLPLTTRRRRAVPPRWGSHRFAVSAGEALPRRRRLQGGSNRPSRCTAAS